MAHFRRISEKYKAAWITVMSLAAIAASVAGIVGVMHSDLFLIRMVEVSELPERSPVDADKIIQLAEIPLDSINLFSLKLSAIEKRVMSHPWVSGVTISKRFPQTVSIAVKLREPTAILQGASGSLTYLDAAGTPFAPISLKSQPDLPLVLGFAPEQVPQALALLTKWKGAGLDGLAQISSVELEKERGLRVVVTYPLKQGVGRVMVELGRETGEETDSQLARLREVMTYLSQNGINARQVFADLGKKIVVRIARSS